MPWLIGISISSYSLLWKHLRQSQRRVRRTTAARDALVGLLNDVGRVADERFAFGVWVGVLKLLAAVAVGNGDVVLRRDRHPLDRLGGFAVQPSVRRLVRVADALIGNIGTPQRQPRRVIVPTVARNPIKRLRLPPPRINIGVEIVIAEVAARVALVWDDEIVAARLFLDEALVQHQDVAVADRRTRFVIQSEVDHGSEVQRLPRLSVDRNGRGRKDGCHARVPLDIAAYIHFARGNAQTDTAMLSQTFFVKVANGLQAKVPLHPGCIYTFEPVPEAGPYDERNKSYLQLVNKSAVPPDGDGIFRVIASRGVVTIQRDEYTPVALNSFIDRCDPNADVSYGPSGRPFPFEKVTPVETTNPRHPYALCLKKHETEAHYFYPGARVELDHIVNVAAAKKAAAAAAKKVAAAAAAATKTAVPSTPAAATAGGGAAPKTAVPSTPAAATLGAAPGSWKTEITTIQNDVDFKSIYPDLDSVLTTMISDEGPLAKYQTGRGDLALEVLGLIKELQESPDAALAARFGAPVASAFEAANDPTNSDTDATNTLLGELRAKIMAAKHALPLAEELNRTVALIGLILDAEVTNLPRLLAMSTLLGRQLTRFEALGSEPSFSAGYAEAVALGESVKAIRERAERSGVASLFPRAPEVVYQSTAGTATASAAGRLAFRIPLFLMESMKDLTKDVAKPKTEEYKTILNSDSAKELFDAGWIANTKSALSKYANKNKADRQNDGGAVAALATFPEGAKPTGTELDEFFPQAAM